MERKTEAAKMKKSWEAAHLLQSVINQLDPTIVHYTETSLREVIPHLFLNLQVPYSKYSSNGRNK